MIKTLIIILKFYYRLVKNRLFVLLSLMFLAVSLEGLGISFILPILQGIESDNPVNRILEQCLSFIGAEFTFLNILICMVIIIFFRTFFLIAQNSLAVKIMMDILINIRNRLMDDIFKLKYQEFLKYSSGYLNNALVYESQKIIFSFNMLSSLIIKLLFIIVYTSIPLFLKPRLIIVVALVSLPLFPLFKMINIKTKNLSRFTSARSADLQKFIIQSLTNYKYLKATGKYSNVLKKIYLQSKELGNLLFKQRTLAVISQNGFEPFVAIIIAGTVYYFVEIKNQNIIEHAFILYLINRSLNSIIGLQSNFRKLLNAWGSIEVISKLEHDLVHNREKEHDSINQKEISFNKPVIFRNVSFKYNNSKEILSNINIEIEPKSTIAIVGESGAGKSTLVNLIIGLLSPTSGDISLGDNNYRTIDRIHFKQNIGYITQENVIFNDNIFNNITLWEAESTENELAEVIKCTKQAHIHDFINNLEKGYHSMLGESGINISGGQRQRICISRELYKNAELLVFDEATSALDTKTEKEIQKNIDELKGAKTIILIAHRLSTIKNADTIFVLKNGKIIGQGNFNELYSNNSEFKQMVDLQST